MSDSVVKESGDDSGIATAAAELLLEVALGPVDFEMVLVLRLEEPE